jgi:hypothetical protein
VREMSVPGRDRPNFVIRSRASGSCVRKDVGVQLPPRPPPLTCEASFSHPFQRDQMGYALGMLGTFNDWMLGLPAILQVLVASAVLLAIGMAPLLIWLAFAMASTRDAALADQDRAKR